MRIIMSEITMYRIINPMGRKSWETIRIEIACLFVHNIIAFSYSLVICTVYCCIV